MGVLVFPVLGGDPVRRLVTADRATGQGGVALAGSELNQRKRFGGNTPRGADRMH
jgi:hypothetical protein